ncbi:hypothetical protein GGI42DRAFT_145042 [Trichoderma sp. SZMC 28013]
MADSYQRAPPCAGGLRPTPRWLGPRGNPFASSSFFPSNAKDSLPRRNSEAETLPGAMTLAESRRSPPRWIRWILSPGKRAHQTREPCLGRSSTLYVRVQYGAESIGEIACIL